MESKISLPNRTYFETPDITPEKGDQMPTEDATPQSQNEDEFPVAVKKLQKKLQLKQLILQKFRIKFNCSHEKDPELNVFIMTRLDELFNSSVFDEKDLVKLDREIQAKVDQIKAKKKAE